MSTRWEDLAREYGLDRTEAQAGLRALAALEEALREDGLEISPTLLESPGPAGTSRRVAPSSPAEVAVGRYVDPEPLARGGMGAIFRAFDPELGRTVAVKVVGMVRPSATAVARFVREARITGQLEHPSIPPVHELGRIDDERPFFSMKLVAGHSMAEVLDEMRAKLGRVDLASARRPLLAALVKVCDALAFAHSRGVVHRDLKPANVMLGDFGEVLVMDWGIAAVRGEPDGVGEGAVPIVGAADVVTLDGAVLGTPAYMSPEQFEGRLDRIDARTDVYSLGAMLFEILTLARPRLERFQDRSPDRPSRLAPDAAIPAELDALVARAMEPDPERRYPSIEALRADLVAHLEGRLVSVARYGPLDRLAKWVRRNPTASAVAGAAAALLLVVSGLFAWRLDARRREAEASARRDGDLLMLAELEDEAERALWPPVPSRRADLEGWLVRARELAARADEHAERLDATGGDGPARVRLSELVQGLERLASRTIPDVERRRSRALDLEAGSAGRAADWARAIASVRDPAECLAYGGLELAAMEDLVPIGRDPDSGLWEFAHLLSGKPPARDAGGRLVLEPASGLVLVLVPAGEFLMGSDRSGAVVHPDPYSLPDEGPRHPVAVGAFLLAKDELTRAQWARIAGGDAGGSGSRLEPATSISWEEADLALARAGLALPTEVQWEYAARAGSLEPWWTGENSFLLQGALNLADESIRRVDPATEIPFENWIDDGFPGPAPVGRFRANPFGLRDVLGNASEWCLDEYAPYGGPIEGRGVYRVHRGGDFLSLSRDARSAKRDHAPPAYRSPRLGVRPARPID